jgi:hypothetical protein
MKSKAGMLAAMAMAMASGSMDMNRVHHPIESSETQEEKRKRIERNLKYNKIKRGAKEFFYGEKSLLALNKENADRKARLKGWIE